ERDNSRSCSSGDSGYLRREPSKAKAECDQKRHCRDGRLRYPSREDVVLHHLHAARDGSADAIQGDARQCAEDKGQRGQHLARKLQSSAKYLQGRDGEGSDETRLHENQDDGCAKEVAAAREVAGRLRTRDKSCDGVIESEDCNFTS